MNGVLVEIGIRGRDRVKIILAQNGFALRIFGNHCDFEVRRKVRFLSGDANLNRVGTGGHKGISSSANIMSVNAVFTCATIAISEVPLAPFAPLAYADVNLGA